MVWSLVGHRSWFRHPNLWLGSVALLAITLGVMDFFQPYRGALAKFTLDGDVSLGGNIGQAIVGPVAWLGVLRLVGIAVAGLAVTTPALAADSALRFGQLAIYAFGFLAIAVHKLATYGYIFLTTAVHKLATATYIYIYAAVASHVIVRNYRLYLQRRALRRRVPAHADTAEPNMLPEMLTSSATEPSDSELEHSLSAIPSTSISQVVTDAGLGSGDAEIEDEAFDVPGKPSAEEETESASPVGGKFNRLWASYESEGDGLPEDGDMEGVEDGPAPTNGAQAKDWPRPSLNLLVEVPEGGVTEEEMQETAATIKRTLAEYGVEVDIGQIRPGPTVTMYGLVPGWVRRYKQVKETDDTGRPILDEYGKPVVKRVESKTRVKVDSILSREKDLALALKTPSIRIETPVMGKSLLGIEVPNPNSSLVTLRSAMESEEFERLRTKAQLPIALGKGSGGETVVTDLATMPHLLIAGATGSGKSACINAVISCLIMEKTPEEMRLLLIDPKRVELTPYNDIPHLLTPVVVETDLVVGLLKGLIREMLDRYRRMEEVGVRNIEAYNKKMPYKMPFLVAAVDELADLMISASFHVEQSLCRLAQLGRATGIHLIVATQRPSVDVVTGLIKANFPSRISFGVTSQVDSRTILDTTGADKLLGRGDMLYLPLDASRPVRVQGVFISDLEIENVVNFWRTTPRVPLSRVRLRMVEDDQRESEEEENTDWESRDELLDKAIEMAHSYTKLSTSLMQRRLRIGYPRAARLMDQLEEQGIVGPSDGSKSRDVIMNKM